MYKYNGNHKNVLPEKMKYETEILPNAGTKFKFFSSGIIQLVAMFFRVYVTLLGWCPTI